MPNLSDFHTLIVFIHLLGVFVFLLAHGISAGVLFRLRQERDPAVVRALLDLSRRSHAVMGIGGLIWLLAGITAGFSGGWWTSGRLWIWAAVVLTVVIIGAMTPLGRLYMDRVRVAAGVDGKTGMVIDSAAPVDAAALDAAILTGRPIVVAVLGLGGIFVLAWLMMFKPF